MQNELRWALLAIGVALIILVVMGVKIKKSRQAGLKEFDDASWHPDEDVLVNGESDTQEQAEDFYDDIPSLEDVKAYNPHVDANTPEDIPTAQAVEEPSVPTVSAQAFGSEPHPASHQEPEWGGEAIPTVSNAVQEPTLDTQTESLSGLTSDDLAGIVPVLNASRAPETETVEAAPVVPEFLKKDGADVEEQIAPPYSVKEELADLADGEHPSYEYRQAISNLMGVGDLDVAAALKGSSKTEEPAEPTLGDRLAGSQLVSELKEDSESTSTKKPTDVQASLLFDDEFENQVKKHLEKREAEKQHTPEPASTPKTNAPEPRYSTVESYEGAQGSDKAKQKESDAFKPRYSTVKNLNEDENAVTPAPTPSEPAQATPPVQSVADTVKDVKEPEVIILHIKASDSIGFYGPQIAKTLGDIGMKFGDMGIYHYQSSGQRILSVSNIVKPGYFEPKKFSQFTTPGLSVFASVYPDSDISFIKEVIEKSAQYIAAQLKGTLYDMNHQRINHLASYVGTQMDDIQTIFNEA